MRARVALAGHPQPGALLGARRECALPRSRSCEMRPSPWQVGAPFVKRPVPSQRGQVRLNLIAPAIWVTLPLPLHSGQTALAPRARAGAAASGASLLASDVQADLRAPDRLPEIDVERRIRGPCPSPERSSARPSLPSEQLAENVLKVRRFLPAPGQRRPRAARPAARVKCPEKSKPPKPMFGPPPPGCPATGRGMPFSE